VIARNQWGIECFSKGYVRRVVSREIVSQFPNPRRQRFVRIAFQWNILVVLEGLRGPNPSDFRTSRVPAQDLKNLKIDEVGSVDCFSLRKQAPTKFGRGWRIQ